MKKIAVALHKHKTSMMLFIMVGALSAFVNFSSFTILWKFFDLNYQVAVSIAYVLSVVVHFTANRNLTFKSRNVHVFKQIPKYLVMVSINYLITMIIMYLVVEHLELSPYIGLVCAIGGTVGVGYTISRFWVFKASKE